MGLNIGSYSVNRATNLALNNVFKTKGRSGSLNF